jgi:hypothetical protein
MTAERARGPSQAHNLIYYSGFAKTDGLYEGKEEFVILTRRLPHQVNTYLEPFVNGIVSEVNGARISRLADVKTAVENNTNQFHVIRFAGHADTLVLNAKAAGAADRQILRKYDIASPEHLPAKP